MSSTNHTTNYNLSQFIGADKPAWLSDYNGDMGKIDTAIKNAADTASGADGKADSANTAIGTLASLTTEAKTNLVAAINEVDTNADAAQNTANSAASTASGAATTANGIAAYLALTTYADIAANKIAINAGSIGTKTLSYASNAAGTLGKLYGQLQVVKPTSASTTITISDLPFQITSDFSVNGMCTVQDANNHYIYYPTVNFKTNGTATITMGAGVNGATVNIQLYAVLIFMQNFGDTPEPA